MVSDEFVERWVARLRRELPDAVAVFMGGSHVRGEAGPHSDVDFDIVVADGPRDEWPAWFEASEDRLVRISTWVRDVQTWLAAQDLARSVVPVVAPLNPGPPVYSRTEALRRLLDVETAPAGYRGDMLICLGLGGGSTPADVYASARRLVAGVLDLLDAHVSTFVELLPPAEAIALRDGTFRRYVEQALRSG